jgi:hypothetical protein
MRYPKHVIILIYLTGENAAFAFKLELIYTFWKFIGI